jgi:hypothetical protein
LSVSGGLLNPSASWNAVTSSGSTYGFDSPGSSALVYTLSSVCCEVFRFFARRRCKSNSVAITATAAIAIADAIPALALGDRPDRLAFIPDTELDGEASVIVGLEVAGAIPFEARLEVTDTVLDKARLDDGDDQRVASEDS